MLRDEIAKLLHCDCGNIGSVILADSILSLPSGVEAAKRCDVCKGQKLIQPINSAWKEPCRVCHGTGFISRDLSISEALELLKKGNYVRHLITGETVRVKK